MLVTSSRTFEALQTFAASVLGLPSLVATTPLRGVKKTSAVYTTATGGRRGRTRSLRSPRSRKHLHSLLAFSLSLLFSSSSLLLFFSSSLLLFFSSLLQSLSSYQQIEGITGGGREIEREHVIVIEKIGPICVHLQLIFYTRTQRKPHYLLHDN